MRVVPSVSIPSINAAEQGRRMSLPVNPAFLIYSQFEHVRGTAAPQGSQGIAISQLHVLNVLIGQLAQIRQDAPSAFLPGQEPADPYAQALIEDYRAQILQGMENSAAMPYIPAPSAHSGAVFSLVA